MTIRELIENRTITLDTVVLGTLPVTKDRCIIGDGAEMHFISTRGTYYAMDSHVRHVEPTAPYSTREAAEAARKEPHAKP